MSEKIFEEIRNFVFKQTYIRDFSLFRETRIEEDLGITGADAIEFMVAYGKRFNVDVSKFMAADYFEAEGMNWLPFNATPDKKILTLGDLEKGILAGRLDEEIINSSKHQSEK
jgi:hypothetical protein